MTALFAFLTTPWHRSCRYKAPTAQQLAFWKHGGARNQLSGHLEHTPASGFQAAARSIRALKSIVCEMQCRDPYELELRQDADHELGFAKSCSKP